MNKDNVTTVLGVILGALVASQVDYAKLLAGEHNEIAKVVGCVVLALNGWLTNKR